MADFLSGINAISSIVTSNSVTSTKRISDLATIISTGAVDSVNFSDNSKNLFALSDINSKLDEILGIPNEQNSDMQSLGNILNNFLNSGELEPKKIDQNAIIKSIESIYGAKELDDKDKKRLSDLAIQLQEYTQNIAITSLFSSQNDNIFTSNSVNSLFSGELTDEQKIDFSKVAKQLTPVLFTTSSDEATSFLDTLGSLYGLNSTSDEQNDEIFSLFNQRNSLLSSILINKNIDYTYSK